MSELSKDAQDLLARARAVPPLARDRQIKVRAALIGQIALAPATGAAAGALGKLGFAKALVLVSAVGVVGTGALIAARNAEDPGEREDRTAIALRTATPASENERGAAAAPSAREAPQPSKVEAPVERGPVAAPEAAKHESRAATKKSGSSEPVAGTVTPAPPAAKTDPDTLREEIELVRQANALLRSGKPEQARALLDQHGQKFASGALREEREAARILALCALGKQREAQAAAAKFLRDSPRSMQAARVRASCAKKRSTDAR